MTRLDSELQRLYPACEPGLARTMVLAVSGAGSWDALSAAWKGVQADLQLPAPAIAVTGQGYQLWFSLLQPVAAARALEFLGSLRRRYLADVAEARIHLQASPLAMPPQEVASGRWSAFVAPDLAALFAEEPWLDLKPGDEAQAELLSRLQGMAAADLEQALPALSPAQPSHAAPATPQQHEDDPRRFLLAVMNDPAVPLPLRIEAAKALLPYSEGGRRP